MDARAIAQVERNVQRAASAIFAGACAFAAYSWLTPVTQPPFLVAAAGLAFVVAYVVCGRALDAIGSEAAAFPQGSFAVAPVETVELAQPVELVLTDADRVPISNAPEVNEQALLLDDVVEQLGPDSRVVRLFDPAAMPTAGELKDRIDRHLDRGTVNPRTPDASQALYDALAELRHELR